MYLLIVRIFAGSKAHYDKNSCYQLGIATEFWAYNDGTTLLPKADSQTLKIIARVCA